MSETGGIAILPMYDWPAVRHATDALWAGIRDALRSKGIAAPDGLSRQIAPATAWASRDLVLGQTCGLPYVCELRGKVTLIGTPDYGLEMCPPGHYDSAIVIRRNDTRASLSAFSGARLALNGPESQSGCRAMLQHISSHWAPDHDEHFFAQIVQTGSHARSVEAVAQDRADIAAIDGVTWRLAQASLPAASQLRVLGRTAPMPGLPLITARHDEAWLIADTVEEAIAACDQTITTALGLRRLVRTAPVDYDPVGNNKRSTDRLAAAHGLSYRNIIS